MLSTLLSPARLSRRDVWLTLIPLLIWLATLYSRSFFIHPSCSATAPCQASQVLFMDRPSIGQLSGDADFYSYVLQNSTGVVALASPMLYQSALLILGQATPQLALAAGGVDLVIFLQSWFVNGALNESARILIGRARPYLYAGPGNSPAVEPQLFSDPQNYTSFYSGHTSFVTVACIYLFLTLLGRGAPTPLLIGWALLSECLIVSTGVFRILAGRHFLSDVLVAIIMGSLTAFLVAWVHKTRERKEQNLLPSAR
jgi:membrane-associated phospholipid phosphatase